MVEGMETSWTNVTCEKGRGGKDFQICSNQYTNYLQFHLGMHNWVDPYTHMPIFCENRCNFEHPCPVNYFCEQEVCVKDTVCPVAPPGKPNR